MLIVISPAKTLDFETASTTEEFTLPDYLEDSEKLVRKLRTYSRKKLGALMDISPALAKLNQERYVDWQPDFSLSNAKQALLAFKGDVYLGLEAEAFAPEDLEYAQNHLRILSGLYGLLRPLDLIQPYRLEMGTRLPVRRKKNLYEFWGDRLTKAVNEVLAQQERPVLVNLASNEYFSALNPEKVKGELVTPVFKDWKNGEYKVISFFAKKARGRMTAWLLKHRVEHPDGIKDFDLDGYSYSEEASQGGEWTFLRKEDAD